MSGARTLLEPFPKANLPQNQKTTQVLKCQTKPTGVTLKEMKSLPAWYNAY